VQYIDTTGTPQLAQPAFSNLSGSLALSQTPLTTAGDLLYANSTPALARLAIGSTNQFLGISAGLPAWVQPSFSNLSGSASTSQLPGSGVITIGGTNCTLGSSCTLSTLNGVTFPAAPSTNTVPVVTSSNTITYETVPNAALASSATTVNGQTCTLGSACSVNSGAPQYSLAVNGASGAAMGGISPSSTSGVPLISQGSSANPTFGALNLAGGSAIVTGTLPSGNLPSALVYTGQANTYSSGNKQTFGASTSSAASINLPSGTAPSSPAAGDAWYDGDRMYTKDAETNSGVVSSVPRRFTITSAVTATSTTPVAVGSFAVAANKAYCLMCQLFIQSSSTSNAPTITMSCPASPIAVEFGFIYATSATAHAQATATSCTTLQPGSTATASSTFLSTLSGMLQNGSNAGSLTVQIESSGSYNTIIEPGSFCVLY
jgi:hypothetical protein